MIRVLLLVSLLALSLNELCHLFLRQCFVHLPLSTETLINGMLRKLPLWLEVSQYVYRTMVPRDVNSCYCDWGGGSSVGVGGWWMTWRDLNWCYYDWRVLSGVWVHGDEEYGKLSVLPWPIVTTDVVTNGDSLVRCPSDISCFLVVTRFLMKFHVVRPRGISLWDFMLIEMSCCSASWDFFMRFHAF